MTQKNKESGLTITCDFEPKAENGKEHVAGDLALAALQTIKDLFVPELGF